MYVNNYSLLYTLGACSWAEGSWGKEFLLENFKKGLLGWDPLTGPIPHHQKCSFTLLSCSECSECADLFGLYVLFLEAGTLSRKLTWKLLRI